MEEGFEIRLNATTEQQRSKLAQWAQSRTKDHTVLVDEHGTTFAGVFVNKIDFKKFAVTFARNSKNWGIVHIDYTRWIAPISESEYVEKYGEVKTIADVVQDKTESIKQELRALGMVPPPKSWDLSGIANAAELLERVRRGNPPPISK